MIEQVLFTSPGERSTGRTSATACSRWQFQPNAEPLALAVQATVQASLHQWLGQLITVEKVTVVAEDATLMVTVSYGIKDSRSRGSTCSGRHCERAVQTSYTCRGLAAGGGPRRKHRQRHRLPRGARGSDHARGSLPAPPTRAGRRSADRRHGAGPHARAHRGRRPRPGHQGRVLSTSDILTITVSGPGDFYCPRLVDPVSGETPTGFDPRVSAVDFSFKAGCPIRFDCLPSNASPAAVDTSQVRDYLAKDYDSFRQLMLDRLATTLPDWTERNPADLQVAPVELPGSQPTG